MSATGKDDVFEQLNGPGRSESGGGGDDDPSTAALRMDLLGTSAIDVPTDAPTTSRFGGQIAVLAMVVLAAGAGLLAMRYVGMGPRSSQGETIKIDYDLNVQHGNVDHKQLLEDLAVNRTATQVAPDEVQRNPFKFAGSLEPEVPPELVVDDSARAEADRRRREAEERSRRIDQTFATLELNMVVGGSSPVARISGAVVRPGDMVQDLFKVTGIEGRSVLLECDGRTYVLGIAEEGGVRRTTRQRR